MLILKLYYAYMHEERVYNLETIEMDKYTMFKSNFPPILAPRWRDDKFIINARVKEHNRIVCTYTLANGNRMFPHPLYVSGKTARKYKPFPMAMQRGGFIDMRAIPISEFKILKIAERSLHDLY